MSSAVPDQRSSQVPHGSMSRALSRRTTASQMSKGSAASRVTRMSANPAMKSRMIGRSRGPTWESVRRSRADARTMKAATGPATMESRPGSHAVAAYAAICSCCWSVK